MKKNLLPPLLLSIILVIWAIAYALSAQAQSCPDNKYPHKGQCLWLHEIDCPRGQEYDIFKKKCVGCESFGKVWKDYPGAKNKSGGYCECARCQEETGDGCTPCHEIGKKCIKGECSDVPGSPPYNYQGSRALVYGFTSSTDEINQRRRLISQGIEDLEAQLGKTIDKVFGYCECQNPKGVFIWASALNEKSREVESKISEVARKECGGCVTSPKLDYMR